MNFITNFAKRRLRNNVIYKTQNSTSSSTHFLPILVAASFSHEPRTNQTIAHRALSCSGPLGFEIALAVRIDHVHEAKGVILKIMGRKRGPVHQVSAFHDGDVSRRGDHAEAHGGHVELKLRRHRIEMQQCHNPTWQPVKLRFTFVTIKSCDIWIILNSANDYNVSVVVTVWIQLP